MNEKQLFDAINCVDNKFIDETIKSIKYKSSMKKRINFKVSFAKLIAAVLTIITILGTSLTVFACVNQDFKNWIYQSFKSSDVTEITSIDSNSSKFVLDKNMQIDGVNESFLIKYKTNSNNDDTVDKVYQIKKKKIKLLKQNFFEGYYNKIKFNFYYCTIGSEIYAFNCSNNIDTVFHYKNEDTIYLSLDDEQNKLQLLIQLNLKSEEIIKIFEHRNKCNYKMSPNGKTILLNYRSQEYWSVFDLQTQKETNLPSVFPYAHTEEILFLNDYLIETCSCEYNDNHNNTEMIKTITIDLKTFKTKTVCEGTGDICGNWLFNYDIDKDRLEIKNLYSDSSFYVDKVSDNSKQHSISTVAADKYFALFYNETTKEYYLCNLIDETSMKFTIPDELYSQTEIFLVSSEKKLIITNDKTAYLIDIKNL